MGLQATVTEGVQGHRGCPGSSRVSRVITGVWGPSRWVSKVHHGGRAGHRRSRVRRGGCPGHHGGVQGSLMDFQVCRAPHSPVSGGHASPETPRQRALPGLRQAPSPKPVSIQAQSGLTKGR